jgi:hypothetical protein
MVKAYKPLPSEGDAFLYGHGGSGTAQDPHATLGCCDQGGCCRISPPREVLDSAGNVVRVNVLLQVRSAVSAYSGGGAFL